MQMSTSFRHPGGDFDWVAPVYDALSRIVFSRSLQRAQTVFLHHIPANASVLIVGGGTGYLLEQVLTQCKPTRVLYLETSAQMVARTSRRMLQKPILGSVEFRVGDEATLRADDRFDVILTPFVLDLFTEKTLTDSMLPRLHQTLKPDGYWLVTDFVETNLWWQKLLLSAMIRFFRITAGIETHQLADWQQLLANVGLRRLQSRQVVGGMVVTQVWQGAPTAATIS